MRQKQPSDVWRVHTPNLLREVQTNKGTEALRIPLAIFGRILYDVAERAAELNDPLMNTHMMRLALYEVADATSSNYDQKLVFDALREHGFLPKRA